MTDLISRADAIKAVCIERCDRQPHDCDNYRDNVCAVIGGINALPSAEAVQVVRCKNCKWYEADIMGNPWGVCCHNGWVGGHNGHEVSEDGWCYRAEMREVES